MTRIRWTSHAIESLVDRAIRREDADKTLHEPSKSIPGHGGRTLFVRAYHDVQLAQAMLICVVAEIHDDELVVVTVFKTSKIEKYLKGGSS